MPQLNESHVWMSHPYEPWVYHHFWTLLYFLTTISTKLWHDGVPQGSANYSLHLSIQHLISSALISKLIASMQIWFTGSIFHGFSSALVLAYQHHVLCLCACHSTNFWANWHDQHAVRQNQYLGFDFIVIINKPLKLSI